MHSARRKRLRIPSLAGMVSVQFAHAITYNGVSYAAGQYAQIDSEVALRLYSAGYIRYADTPDGAPPGSGGSVDHPFPQYVLDSELMAERERNLGIFAHFNQSGELVIGDVVVSTGDGSGGGGGGTGGGADGLSAYQIAVRNGYTGNEASWLTSLRGPAGTDGKQVELRKTTTHIQWRYFGVNETWVDLVPLSDLGGGSAGGDGTTSTARLREDDADPGTFLAVTGYTVVADPADPGTFTGTAFFEDPVDPGTFLSVFGSDGGGTGGTALSDSGVAALIRDSISQTRLALDSIYSGSGTGGGGGGFSIGYDDDGTPVIVAGGGGTGGGTGTGTLALVEKPDDPGIYVTADSGTTTPTNPTTSSITITEDPTTPGSYRLLGTGATVGAQFSRLVGATPAGVLPPNVQQQIEALVVPDTPTQGLVLTEDPDVPGTYRIS